MLKYFALAGLLALGACDSLDPRDLGAEPTAKETPAAPSVLAPGLTVKGKGYSVMLGGLTEYPRDMDWYEAPYFVRAGPKTGEAILTCTILTAKGELLAGIATPIEVRQGGMLRTRVTRKEPARYDCTID